MIVAEYAAQVAPRTEFHEINGLRHRVLRWGGAARPIVLLHGFLDTADTFQFLVDALPREWSFAAPDWRGFGASAEAGRPYWFPEYYADLERLLDILSPGLPARVIGHSMGGNIATHYAGIRPARLEWLVSIEGFGLPRTRSEQAPDRYAHWLDELRAPLERRRYESLAKLAALIRRRNPRLRDDVAQFVARAWSRPVERGEGGGAAAGASGLGAVELAHDPYHRLVNPVLSRREESEACWQRVTADVLMLLGAESETRDRLGADGGEAYFRRQYARVDLVTLPEVGHMMHHEKPAAVAQVLVDWIGRRAGAMREGRS